MIVIGRTFRSPPSVSRHFLSALLAKIMEPWQIQVKYAPAFCHHLLITGQSLLVYSCWLYKDQFTMVWLFRTVPLQAHQPVINNYVDYLVMHVDSTPLLLRQCLECDSDRFKGQVSECILNEIWCQLFGNGEMIVMIVIVIKNAVISRLKKTNSSGFTEWWC